MKRKKEDILNKIKGGLLVSCQALPGEPLHSSFIMGRMALAAQLAGACGIRANSKEDITEIKKQVELPILGIIKKSYGENPVFITPTMAEIDTLAACGCDIIATDATKRLRPEGQYLEEFFAKVRRKYPDQLFMADISDYEEGVKAAELGFDLVGTTLCGYTEDTKGSSLPDLSLIARLAKELDIPVVAEGGIHYPDQLRRVFEAGAGTAVVGGAITRPLEIAKRFIEAIPEPGQLKER